MQRTLSQSVRTGSLTTSTVVAAAIRIASVGITVLASLLYARILGPHGYGIYTYVATCAAILAIPASLGFSQYLVREGAVSGASTRALLRWADPRTLSAGVASALLLAAAALVPQAAGARVLFLCATPLPILTALAMNRQAILQVRGAYVASQWPQLLLMPMVLLGSFMGLSHFAGLGGPLLLMALTVASAAAILPLYSRLLGRHDESDEGSRPQSFNIRSALPFMWLGLVYFANNRIDLLMLGALRGAHSAGTYAIASRAAELVSLLLVLTGAILAPQFARLYGEKRHDDLQLLSTKVARWTTALTLPGAIVLFVWAKQILLFVLGPEYASAATPLRILVAANLINVITGPSGMLLNMTGNEKISAISIGIGVAINCVLAAVLIPSFGAVGGAFATSISILTWNALLSYFVRTRLGLRAGVFF